MEPIIALLDGANDYYSKEEELACGSSIANKQNNKNDPKAVAFKKDKTIRYQKSEDN
jgi:hypothetical protein